MIRYLIVDDEPLAHELIEEFCGMLPHLELAKNCYNALEAMQFLNSDSVDIMFLDLNMPKLKGVNIMGNPSLEGEDEFRRHMSQHMPRCRYVCVG